MVTSAMGTVEAVDMLAAALAYAHDGWQIFPLHTPGPDGVCDCKEGKKCSSSGKHPRVRDWENAATSNEETIRRWWSMWPMANIGVAVGKCGLLVIDQDGDIGAETLARQGGLPVTPTVQTGNGAHYYLALPSRPVGNKVRFAPGLDTRAHGGLTVLPPSLHPSGRRYSWTVSPAEAPPAVVPNWVLSMFPEKKSVSTPAREDQDVPPALAREVGRARAALRQLAKWRCENYSDWVAVGMALADLGPKGLELWDEWSQECGEKYEEGACATHWESFKRTEGVKIGLGSLFRWANDDGAGTYEAPPPPPPPPPPEAGSANGWSDWGEPTGGGEGAPLPTPRIFSMVDMWDHQKGLQRAWGNWILLNNITVIGGVSNVGKSPLLLAVVAGFLKGCWPDGSTVPAEMEGRSVVYCIPEGYGEQTELLMQWGLSKEVIAERVKMPAVPMPGAPDVPNFIFKLDTEQGSAVLAHYCQMLNPGLIVIDGLRAAMSGEEASSADVDRFMAPLVRLAVQHNAAILISHHLTKGSEMASADGIKPSIDWFRGSGHIVAVARSAWVVDRPNPQTPNERRVTLVKAAAGPSGVTMGFSMGDPVDGLEFMQTAPKPPPKSKKDQARQWILQVLKGGKRSHKDLEQLAQDEGLEFSEATLRNARVALSTEGHIISVIENKEHYWALPAKGVDVDDIPI